MSVLDWLQSAFCLATPLSHQKEVQEPTEAPKKSLRQQSVSSIIPRDTSLEEARKTRQDARTHLEALETLILRKDSKGFNALSAQGFLDAMCGAARELNFMRNISRKEELGEPISEREKDRHRQTIDTVIRLHHKLPQETNNNFPRACISLTESTIAEDLVIQILESPLAKRLPLETLDKMQYHARRTEQKDLDQKITRLARRSFPKTHEA